MDYKEMATLLAAKLTDEEFSRLSEGLDMDHGDLAFFVAEIDCQRHPELYEHTLPPIAERVATVVEAEREE